MKLPVVSWRDVVNALKKAGFNVVKLGPHIKMKRPSDRRVVIVPKHDEIAKGTLLSILRQAGISKAEFIKYLRNCH